MRILAAFGLVFLIAACSSSYGSLDIPFMNKAPASQETAAQQPQQIPASPPQPRGDFTVTQAPPLAAIPNEPVKIASISDADSCLLPAGLVGKNKSVLQTMKFVGPVRILRIDSPMTMDFNPERLNIIYDEKDVILDVKCG
jgi:hypothetical protein